MEIWKKIKGYEGYYEVSNLGSIKSLTRKVNHSKSNTRIVNERILRQNVNNSGYYSVCLAKEGKNKRIMNHILVSKAFLNNAENKRTVNHIDGNKLNNNLSNLEYMTDSENQIHALNMGFKPKGSNHKNSKLSETDVLEIRKSNDSLLELSIKFKVCKTTICQIKNKKRWKWL